MYYTGLCLALTTSGTATSDQLQLLHKLLDWPVDYIFPSEYRKVDRLLLMYQAIVCRDGTIMFSLFITITRKLQGFWDYFSKEMDVYVTLVCPSWEVPPRHVNNFAVLHAVCMELAPIDSACKRGFYI